MSSDVPALCLSSFLSKTVYRRNRINARPTSVAANVTAGETPYPRFSREQLIALSPDVVIITSMTRSDAFDQVLAEWNRWPQIQAVRNKRIYMADSDLFDRPSPRLVDGLEALVKLIHPELFEDNK